LHMDLFGPTFVKSLNKKSYCLVITDDYSRVLVMKPHNKTPRELFLGRKHALSFMRPFGCPVIILNAIDHLGKFDGKADEGFFVRYSTNRKAFRVLNGRTRIMEENLHVKFSKNTPNIAGSRPNWIFDVDALTRSINYKPVITGNQSNGSAGTKACDNIGKTRVETVLGKDYILLPLWTQDPLFSSSSKDSLGAGFKLSGEEEKKDVEDLGNKDSEVPSTEEPRVNQEKDENVNNTNNINTISPTDNTVGIVYGCADGLNIPDLEEIGRYGDAEDDDSGVDMNNLDIYFQVAYALFKDFVVYEMDVKSDFLYGKIEEEVYVCQPPGFEDPDFPDRVYKVEKALYRLHQAPKAWYKTLSTYLLDNSQIMDKCKTRLGYNAIPSLYNGNFMPPKHDLVHLSLDDFVDVNENVSECVIEKPTDKSNEPKAVRNKNEALIIEDWVSESEEEDEPKVQTVKPNFTKLSLLNLKPIGNLLSKLG
nr:ribonuclease H-like domain-containing protein [Tanacetum cinerariifolium]